MRNIIVQKCSVFALVMVLAGVFCTPGVTATWNEMVGNSEINKGDVQQYYNYGNYREDGILLITDSTSDTVCMFDPYDGTYLGDFCTIPPIHGTYLTPVNAIPGPDGNIYVSDQVQDAVFVFNSTGTFLYEYANDTDGLNNVRGIAFRGTHLFVTSGDDYVAEFDGPHSRLPDFINDGSEPFDIFFLDDGRALLSDIYGSTDNVRLYYANGTLDTVLFQINFPQQIMNDTILPGSYLNAGFSGGQITDFDLDGTIVQTTPFSSGRGVYRLGNENLLLTDGDGVWEIEPGTGSVVGQKKGGSSHFIEYYGPTQEGYTLTIIIDGNGTVTKNPDQLTYPPGTPVELTAIPDPNWNFAYWIEDGYTFYDNPLTINMTENRTIIAYFYLYEEYAINFYEGWNLITVPVENDFTAETLGQSIDGCSVVTFFDSSTQTFTTHVVDTPHDDFPILDGVGYFVYVTTDSIFNVIGLDIETVNVPLSSGWNLIGWYHNYSTTAESVGENISGTSVVTMFYSETQTFITHVVDVPHDDFQVTAGMGLFIYTSEASIWHGEG